MEFIQSRENDVPEICESVTLLIVTGWGKAILQVSIAVSSGAVVIGAYFSAKDGPDPLEKNWPVRL